MFACQSGERRGDPGGLRAAVRHPPRDVVCQRALRVARARRCRSTHSHRYAEGFISRLNSESCRKKIISNILSLKYHHRIERLILYAFSVFCTATKKEKLKNWGLWSPLSSTTLLHPSSTTFALCLTFT